MFQTPDNHRFEIPTKKRVYFTPEQRAQLEELYKSQQYPTRDDKSALAKSLNIDENKIQVWFQNRRARDRNRIKRDTQSFLCNLITTIVNFCYFRSLPYEL